jgi:hypothetical protein
MNGQTFLTHWQCAAESGTKMADYIILVEVTIMNMRHIHRYFLNQSIIIT